MGSRINLFLFIACLSLDLSQSAWQSERIRPLPVSHNSLKSKTPVMEVSSAASLVKEANDVNVPSSSSPSQPLLSPSSSSSSESSFMKKLQLPINPLPNPERMSLDSMEDHEAMGSSRSQMDTQTPKTAFPQESNSSSPSIYFPESLSSSSDEERDMMERMINDPVTLVPEDEDAAAAEIANANEDEEEESSSRRLSSPSSSLNSNSGSVQQQPSLRHSSSGRKPTLRYLSAPLSDGRTSILIPLPMDLDEKSGVVFVEDIRDSQDINKRTFRTHIFRPSRTLPISITLKPSITGRGSRARGARHSTATNTINDLNKLLTSSPPSSPDAQTIKMISVSDKFLTTSSLKPENTPSKPTVTSSSLPTTIPASVSEEEVTESKTTTETPTTRFTEETTQRTPTTVNTILRTSALSRNNPSSLRGVPLRKPIISVSDNLIPEQPPIPDAPIRITTTETPETTTEVPETTTLEVEEEEETTTPKINRVQTILRVISTHDLTSDSLRTKPIQINIPTSRTLSATTRAVPSTTSTTTTTTTTPRPTTTTPVEEELEEETTTTSQPIVIRVVTRRSQGRSASTGTTKPSSRTTVLSIQDQIEREEALSSLRPSVSTTSDATDAPTTERTTITTTDIPRTTTRGSTTSAPLPSTTRRPNTTFRNARSNTTTSKSPSLDRETDPETIHAPLTVPGVPGIDYPLYAEIPLTTFDCRTTEYPGFYADLEAGCQVYHSCGTRGRRHSFLCPNGTIFSQEYLICDWWYNVQCIDSPNHFQLNKDAFSSPPAKRTSSEASPLLALPDNKNNSFSVHDRTNVSNISNNRSNTRNISSNNSNESPRVNLSSSGSSPSFSFAPPNQESTQVPREVPRQEARQVARQGPRRQERIISQPTTPRRFARIFINSMNSRNNHNDLNNRRRNQNEESFFSRRS